MAVCRRCSSNFFCHLGTGKVRCHPSVSVGIANHDWLSADGKRTASAPASGLRPVFWGTLRLGHPSDHGHRHGRHDADRHDGVQSVRRRADPAIILMDEPSSALDPIGRLDVIKIIDSLRSKGKTIILSTHILSDVERVCDRVGLLVGGKIVIEGKLRDVLDKYAYDIFNVYVDESLFDKVIDKAKTCKYFVSATKVNDHVEIEYLGEGKKEMFKCLSSMTIDIDGIVKKEPTIEQVFLLASKEVENV